MCEKIWDKFESRNMDDYHNHYLKKRCIVLADVFEKFIDTCLRYYGFDPCNYFSSPGLSWDVILKVTVVKLEKIPDIDKYYLLYLFKGYAKSNDKYMNDYDPKQPSTFIT